MKNETKGLHNKFIILHRQNDTPVQYPCFVLRIDGTDPIAIEALKTYATMCQEPLSSDLFEHIKNTPIKLTAQQIIEKSDYILDMYVEGVSNEQYAILRDLLELAKRAVKNDD